MPSSRVNKARKSKIVTIEDPIEFVFKDRRSLVDQREIGALAAARTAEAHLADPGTMGSLTS